MDKVVHFEITAGNLERAKSFYKTVFGWEIKDMPEMNYIMLQTAKTDEKGMIQEIGAINGGMIPKADGIVSNVLTIGVEDIDKSIELVEKNGGKLIKPKQEVMSMGISAYVKDSEGNVIGLWQNTRKM